MPKWYEKYFDLLEKLKKQSRATSIHLWHEETLARLRARLMDLETKKIRTRLSRKQCI